LTPLTFLLDWEINCQFAGLLWAEAEGLYREAGLALSILPPSQHGQRDLAAAVLDAPGTLACLEENLLVQAAASGRAVCAVAAMLRHTPLVLMTAADGPVHRLDDLVGRRVAMHPDGIALLRALLRLRGIDPGTVRAETDNWDLTALLARRFDAVQGYRITEALRLEQMGFDARLIPLADPALHPQSQVIVAAQRTIAAQAAPLRLFLDVTFAAWAAVLRNPQRAAQIVAAQSAEHRNPAENLEILRAMAPLLRGPNPALPLGALDPAQWQRNLESYRRFGPLSGDIALENVIALGLEPRS